MPGQCLASVAFQRCFKDVEVLYLVGASDQWIGLKYRQVAIFFPSFVNSNFNGNGVFRREGRKTLSRNEEVLGSDFRRVGEKIHSGGEQKRSQHMVKMQRRDK